MCNKLSFVEFSVQLATDQWRLLSWTVAGILQQKMKLTCCPLFVVVCAGSHTFGRARCAVVTPRFTKTPLGLNDTNVIDPKLKAKLLKNCANASDPNFVENDLDQTTPNTFDNKYYTNLVKELGVLHTDQNLFSAQGANTGLVKLYGQKQNLFFSAFAEGMIKMQNLGPLTGTQGQIRLQCGKVNPSSSSSSSWTSSAESLLLAESLLAVE
jgi:peroxidase